MSKLNVSYGLNNALQEVFPKPIVATRAPTTSDKNFPIGQRWIDKSGNASYVLTSVASGSANWEGLGGGAATFTSVTSPLYTAPASSDLAITSATGKSIVMTASEAASDAIDINASAGGIDMDATLTVAIDTAANISLDAGTSSNFKVTGPGENLTLRSDGGSVLILSNENVSGCLTIQSDGGTSETIVIRSTLGTTSNSINLLSDNGGINAQASTGINLTTSAVTGNIDINAGTTSGVVDIDAGGAITLDSSAAGISLDAATASNFTVTGAGEDLTLNSTGGRVDILGQEDTATAVYIRGNGGTSSTVRIASETGTGSTSVDIQSPNGGVRIRPDGPNGDAIGLQCSAGGIDMDAAKSINIDSSRATSDAIAIVASNAAGGIDIDAGTAGVDINSDVKLSGAGKQLQVTGGAATDFIGSATLSSGTVTVANTNIAAGDHIFLAYQGTSLSNTGQLSYSISASTSFTIESTNASDANDVSYFIVREI